LALVDPLVVGTISLGVFGKGECISTEGESKFVKSMSKLTSQRKASASHIPERGIAYLTPAAVLAATPFLISRT
jgi:hypothetical protein